MNKLYLALLMLFSLFAFALSAYGDSKADVSETITLNGSLTEI